MRSCMPNFKKSVRTTVAFLLVFVLINAAFFQIYFCDANYYYQDRGVRDELSGTLDCLLVGASECCRGIVPDIVDEELGVNSYNLGMASMTMQGKYDLLSRELSRNPVKLVIMELSTNVVRMSNNHNDLEGDVYYLARMGLADRLKFIFTMMDPSEYVDAYCYFMDRTVDVLQDYVATGKYTTVLKNKRVSKGYKKSGNKAESQLTDYIRRLRCEAEPIEYDQEDIQWLQKIVDLCQTENVRLILCTMPISGKKLCIGSGFEDTRQFYADFAEENGLLYYDFNLYKKGSLYWPEQTGFLDADHLSNEGAENFTGVLTDVLKKVDSGEDVSGLFYDNYDQYYLQQSYWYTNLTVKDLDLFARDIRPPKYRTTAVGA